MDDIHKMTVQASGMTWLGEMSLLEREKTAFVCSQRTPRNLSEFIRRWAMQLDARRDCIICGNESDMEQMAFSLFLMLRIPTVLLMAESIPAVLPAPFERAIAGGRLLVGTHCGHDVNLMTRRTAVDRNALMLGMAQHIVVGYCTPGGEIARSIAGRQNVSFLTRPYNL